MASGDKVYIADKATLDEVRDKIGSTADTGGSSSAGTVMAKENAVLGEVGKIGATNDEQSSSTTTGSIFAKLNYLVNQVKTFLSLIYNYTVKIGNPNDTGGTITTGTVLGKENAILTEANKIGNTADTSGTKTTGTVMAKLNGLFNEVLQTGDKIVTDNNIIKACTNHTTFTLRNLPIVETDILNISGEGFVSSLSIRASASTYTTTIKVYVDGELFFDFGVYGTAAKYITFGAATSSTSYYKLDDLSCFINENSASYTRTVPNILHFKESLRLVTTASASESNDFASIVYGLVG